MATGGFLLLLKGLPQEKEVLGVALAEDASLEASLKLPLHLVVASNHLVPIDDILSVSADPQQLLLLTP